MNADEAFPCADERACRYADMMKLSPVLMNSALTLHNNIIRKAKFQVSLCRPPSAVPSHICMPFILACPCMVTRKLNSTMLIAECICIRELQNFGFTVEQEGDSYSIMFQEAVDAVKFCLQV